MFKHLRLTFLIGLVATGALFLGACAEDDGGEDEPADTNGGTTATEAAGGDDDGGEGAAIDVSMTEWAVTPSATSVAAGEVTFNVTNDGTTPHDFLAIMTDLPADGLPVEAGLVVMDDLEVVAETEELPAGEGAEATEELEAGDYVLICNVAGHYDLGMRTAFTVN